MMSNLKWTGHVTNLLETHKFLHTDKKTCDVLLICEKRKFYAHRFILCSSSDFFLEIFSQLPSNLDETTILLPDIKGSVLENIIKFIYLGETSIDSINLTDFLETINILGIKSAINFECQSQGPGGKRSNLFGQIEEVHVTIQSQKEDDKLKTSFLEEQNQSTTGTVESAPPSPTDKEYEYVEIYTDDGNIQYTMENVDNEDSTNDFILNEENDVSENTYILRTTSSNNKGENSELPSTLKPEFIDINSVTGNDSNSTMIQSVGEGRSGGENRNILKNSSISEIHDVDEDEDDINYDFCGSGGEIGVDADDNTELDGVGESGERKNKMQSPKAYYHPRSLNRIRDETFDSAVNAVVESGLSLQKAATKFDISKTVLWRRVRKHPQYRVYKENPVIQKALLRLQDGESLKNISQSLSIPMSTLHRHKMRLLAEGKLPDTVQVRRRDSKENQRVRLLKALEACRTGISQNQAAGIYGVPKSTLWRHLQKQKEEDKNYSLVIPMEHAPDEAEPETDDQINIIKDEIHVEEVELEEIRDDEMQE